MGSDGQCGCPAGYTRYLCRGRIPGRPQGGTIFTVSDDYRVNKELGCGAYGVVCSGTHVPTDAEVAIKQIRLPLAKNPALSEDDCYKALLRALREIRLMRYFRHDNIVRLYDIIRPPYKDVDSLYLVMDLMHTDLHTILHPAPPGAPQELSPLHKQHFMYQLLDGVSELHRRGVMHRDIKPQNILVNSDCSLKLCDFGLAREVSTDPKTMYVETRWYRAPELILDWDDYDSAVDIWSVGCVFAEVMSPAFEVLFRGRHAVHQMQLICTRLGVPPDDELGWLAHRARQPQLPPEQRVDHTYLRDLRQRLPPPQGLDDVTADPVALEMLSGMLRFSPGKRLTAEQALKSAYFESYNAWRSEDADSDEEAEGEDAQAGGNLAQFDLGLDNQLADGQVRIDHVRELLLQEVMLFHPLQSDASPNGSDAPEAEAREVEYEPAVPLEEVPGGR